MRKWLELAAVVALLAVAAFFIVLAVSVNAVSRELVGTAAAFHKTADASTVAVTDLETAIVDLHRTILIAGGTLNLSRQVLRNERETIAAANAQTIATMKNIDRLVAGTDQSQRAIAIHAERVLSSIEPVMKQTSEDLSSLDPVIQQTRQDLAALEPVIAAAKPVLDNTATTMANADRISKDLAQVADNAVKPRPWYKRVAGYVWAPVKLAAIFAR